MSAFLATSNTQVRWEIYHAAYDMVHTILSRHFPSAGTTLPVEEFEAHLIKHYENQSDDIEGDVSALVHDALLGTIQSMIADKTIHIVGNASSYQPDVPLTLPGAYGVNNQAFEGCKADGVKLSDAFFE